MVTSNVSDINLERSSLPVCNTLSSAFHPILGISRLVGGFPPNSKLRRSEQVETNGPYSAKAPTPNGRYMQTSEAA